MVPLSTHLFLIAVPALIAAGSILAYVVSARRDR